jgi:hypothetical protein
MLESYIQKDLEEVAKWARHASELELDGSRLPTVRCISISDQMQVHRGPLLHRWGVGGVEWRPGPVQALQGQKGAAAAAAAAAAAGGSGGGKGQPTMPAPCLPLDPAT